MDLKRRKRYVGEVYTSSLTDIMFFLLLFFLITSAFATPTVLKLLLPNAKTGTQGVKHPIVIAIDADLNYAIGTTRIAATDLEATLTREIAGQVDPAALIKVDKTVPVQALVDLLEMGNRLKIKMVLATASAKN
jgi:biopolymer transport protein ExbD